MNLRVSSGLNSPAASLSILQRHQATKAKRCNSTSQMRSDEMDSEHGRKPRYKGVADSPDGAAYRNMLNLFGIHR